MSPAQLRDLADLLCTASEAAGENDHAAVLLQLAQFDANAAAEACEAGSDPAPWLLSLSEDADRLRWMGGRLGLADGAGLSAMIRAAIP